jgi:phospholipid transport system transporter-binding protein
MKQTKRKRADVVVPAAAMTLSAGGLPNAIPRPADVPVASRIATTHPLTEDSVMSNASNEEPMAAVPHMYALTASCTVRDSIALKSSLLDLLMDKNPVTIDVRAVERIDTAALQVLCAFVRDRKAAGGNVLWIGCTESFSEAIRLLGLQKVLDIPDSQLSGVAG